MPQRNTLSLSTSDSKCCLFRSGILTVNKEKDTGMIFQRGEPGAAAACLTEIFTLVAFVVLKIGPFTTNVLSTQPNFRC